MIVRIDGLPWMPAEVTYQEPGFGQSGELPLHVYQLIYHRDEFVDLLAEAYGELIDHQRADDDATGEADPPYFQELGYPELKRFLEYPEYLADAVTWLLWQDLLSRTFPDDTADWGNVRWVVSTIDQVEVGSEKVIVSGKAFENQLASTLDRTAGRVEEV